MNLGQLSRSATVLDLASFVAQYPDPALVFVENADAHGTLFDTTAIKLPLVKRDAPFDATATTAAPRVQRTPSGRLPTVVARDPAALEVVFARKTGRNPFSTMITIGRARNNDVCVEVSTVSKLHASLERAAEGFRLVDQGARNGTFLDERRLEPRETAPLNDGARLGFGPQVRALFFRAEALRSFLVSVRAGKADLR